jgi:hypothetical protein
VVVVVVVVVVGVGVGVGVVVVVDGRPHLQLRSSMHGSSTFRSLHLIRQFVSRITEYGEGHGSDKP